MKVDPIYYFIQRLERLISQGNISQARNECTLFLSAIDILTFMSLSADSITYLKSSPYGYSAASTLSVLRILICSDDAPLEVRSGIITPSNITSRTTYDVLMPLSHFCDMNRSTYIAYTLALTIFTMFMCMLNKLNITNNQEYNFDDDFYDKLYYLLYEFVFGTTCGMAQVYVIKRLQDKINELHRPLEMKGTMERLKKESTSESKPLLFVFTDIISLDLISDPVVASNGRVYDRPTITKWINKSKTAPEDRTELTRELIRSKAIETLLSELNDNPNLNISESKALRSEDNTRFKNPYIDIHTGRTVEGAREPKDRYKRFYFLEELLKQCPESEEKPRTFKLGY